ncbi:MAG: ABC transporter permease [Planctomycetota bacterium]|nr:ABC transporter permease [Planctomycetota bacterium]
MTGTKPAAGGLLKRAATSDSALAVFGIVVVSLVATAFGEHFLSFSNFESVVKSQSIIAVMAMGELLVIIPGGIDISIGATFGLAGSAAALSLGAGHSPLTAALIALACGAAVGLANGFFVAKLNIVPFIVTLGMMGIVRGLIFILTDAQSIYIDNPPFLAVDRIVVAWIPLPIWIAAAACIFMHILLSRSVLGGRAYAVGGDEEAARMLGVKTGRVKMFCYVVSGLAAAAAGLMSAAKVEAAYPRAGEGYEFEAIAAVIVGGASITGGKGSAPAAALGALFIGILKNAIIQMDISQYWQQTVNGFAVILVIMLSALISGRRR